MSNQIASGPNLRRWICDWGALTNQADDLFFSMRISNIIRYLLDSKGQSKKWFTGYHDGLINELSGMLASPSLEMQLLTYCRPLTIKKIKTAISHKNRIALEKCLVRLNACFTSRKYLLRIQAIVLDSLRVDDQEHLNQLREVSRCLLSTLLMLYPIESLVELPKRAISRSFSQHYKDLVKHRAESELVILEDIRTIMVPSLNTIQNNINQLQSKEDLKTLADIFFDYHIGYWNKDVDYLSELLRDCLTKYKFKIGSILLTPDISTRNNKLQKLFRNNMKKDLLEILRECVERVVFNIVFCCFDEKYPDTFAQLCQDNQVELIPHISLIIQESIRNQSRFTSAISNTLYMNWIKAISSEISAIVIKNLDRKFLALTDILSDFLSKKRNQPKRINFSRDSLDLILLEFDFKRLIVAHMDNLGLMILKEINFPFAELRHENIVKSFINMEFDALFKELSKEKYFDNIPIHDYDIPFLLDGFFRELTQLLIGLEYISS